MAEIKMSMLTAKTPKAIKFKSKEETRREILKHLVPVREGIVDMKKVKINFYSSFREYIKSIKIEEHYINYPSYEDFTGVFIWHPLSAPLPIRFHMYFKNAPRRIQIRKSLYTLLNFGEEDLSYIRNLNERRDAIFVGIYHNKIVSPLTFDEEEARKAVEKCLANEEKKSANNR